MITRIPKHEYFMSIALTVASRSTCPRRAVGCIIVDKHSRIMATGFNGVPRGVEHCLNNPCLGANLDSGAGLDLCLAIHAEQNALAQCKDTLEIETVYTTAFPCSHCLKQLANTSVKYIYYIEPYPSTVETTKLMQSVGFHQLQTPLLKHLKEIYANQCGRMSAMGKIQTVAYASVPTGTDNR